MTRMTTDSAPSIQALPKHVVDRIAAGEVVQRPVNVVKELLENSLDAKSSTISIHVESSSKITISDNGCGIRPVDLGLAATRFATSKFTHLQDFNSLTTFGFRGEALASVSFVSRLSICSRVAHETVAHVQNYQNGQALFERSKPQARAVGTTVTVKDMFYNLPHRQCSMNEREEYQRILTMVQCYAIHSASKGVGLVCRYKTKVDLNTTTLLMNDASKDITTNNDATLRVLQHVYGSKISFTTLQCAKERSNESDCTFACHGYLSTTLQKKSSLVLFVNNRLVECLPLKKLVDKIMGTPSILYLSIDIPPTQVDVNVHPTKKQVTLLYQDEILNDIQEALQDLIHNQAQSFTTASVETKTSTVTNPYKKQRVTSPQEISLPVLPPRPKTNASIPSNLKIRTTRAAPAGALEPYLVSTNNKEKKHVASCPLSDLSTPGAFAKQCTCPLVAPTQIRPKPIVPSHCTYRSIQSLRKKLWKYSQRFVGIQELLRSAVFVGRISNSQQCLVQCGVELHLWNTREMAQQLFYQLALLQFGGLRQATFPQGIHVTKIMAYAMELEEQGDDQTTGESDSESSSTSHKSTNWELASQATACLMEHAELLQEYFSIHLEQNGDVNEDTVYLKGLPILLNGYEPSPGGLSVFLLRLATEINWKEEKPCFHGICRELGDYYAVVPPNKSIQHSLFPAISFLLTPTPQVESCMRKLTVLSNLYKAFER